MKLMEKREGQLKTSEVSPSYNFEELVDVIVVGLGTAGSMAAIRAASRGLNVLGIERLNCMGGTGTTGGVIGYYYGNRGGLFEDIDRQALNYQKRDDFVPFSNIHAELKNWIMDTEAAKYGAEIHYESLVTGVYLEERTVKGLRWSSPQGVRHTAAKVVIDCTGNAEICEMAGCGFQMGRESDGKAQPFSNVLMKLQTNGRIGNFYTDSGYIDVSDADDVTRAILESSLLGTHLQERYSDEPLLLKTTQLLGIRESRNIEGEERVVFKKFLDGQLTRQPVFYGYSNLDNHGKDMAFESETQQDWLVAASLFGPNFNVPIPMGALIPKGYDGLLAAGRCISLDHDIASAVRQKRDMQKSGETAANMAYLSITRELQLKLLPYDQLLELQLETDCLSASHRMEFREITPQEDNEQAAIPAIAWLTDREEIRKAMSGDKPGIAIWSAKRLGSELHSSLLEWVNQKESQKLRSNSALTLGLLRDPASLQVLREIVYARDLYVPKTSRKYNQPHMFAAIYLLGVIKDPIIMPELMTFLGGDDFLDTVTVDKANDEFIYDRKELYFQLFTFSMMAALSVAETYKEWRAPVKEMLTKRLNDRDFKLMITLKTHIKEANGFLKKKMNETVANIYAKRTAHWI
jgi:hypothetical protein